MQWTEYCQNLSAAVFHAPRQMSRAIKARELAPKIFGPLSPDKEQMETPSSPRNQFGIETSLRLKFSCTTPPAEKFLVRRDNNKGDSVKMVETHIDTMLNEAIESFDDQNAVCDEYRVIASINNLLLVQLVG